MELLAAVLAAALLLGVGLERWLLVHVRSQQRRMADRLDALALNLAAPARPVLYEAIYESALDIDGTHQPGTIAPPFALDVLGGGRLSLGELLAPARPLILVFTSPQCGPCYELLPDIGGWQRVYGDRLTIALISSGAPNTNIAMSAEYGINRLLLQREEEVADAYDVQQFPAAVLVSTDGRITDEPRYGVRAVRQLVADTLGMVLPAPPALDEQMAVGRGQSVPDLRRPDLAGHVIDFSQLHGAPTLLLFWSPGCIHCQEVLPEIRAFEQEPNSVRMLIVSRGPIGLNQEVGFASTVILDDDRSIGRTFGVSSTPAAILIDSGGVVATPIARGSVGVRAALRASVASAVLAPAVALTAN